MKKFFSFVLLLSGFASFTLSAQELKTSDSATVNKGNIKTEMRYNIGNGKTLVYSTPKKFGFITGLPKDAVGIVKTTFSKESIKPLVIIGASTAALLLLD